MLAFRLMKKSRRGLSLLLTMSLLFSLWPIQQASAAEGGPKNKEVLVGLAAIGNRDNNSAGNMSKNFRILADGFSYTKSGNFNIDSLETGDLYLGRGQSVTLTIDVSDNDQLTQLAKSGHAFVEIGWDYLAWNEVGSGCGFAGLGGCYQGTEASMQINNGNSIVADLHCVKWNGGDPCSNFSDSVPLTEDTVIEIAVAGIRDDVGTTGVRGMYIYFKDETAPVLEDYSFKGNGLQRVNPTNGQQELYVKETEYIDLTYHFSEAVRPSEVLPTVADSDTVDFLERPLFVNAPGTGLPAEGKQQYLKNRQYGPKEGNIEKSLEKYYSEITYGYDGIRYHDSDKLPLRPAITKPTDSNSAPTLSDIFKKAEYVDAAGNAAIMDFSGLKPNNSSDPYLLIKQPNQRPNNPFDFENGGFRVFVDAVRPKYSKTSNGIQPEILTGVTLNDNDTIDFTLQFTEEVIPWRDHNTSWVPGETYLEFNNGMKAYYVTDQGPNSGSGTKSWLFRTTLADDVELETALLKVIALAHDNKPSDRLVLQDFAGNMLFQPANFKGEYVDGDDRSLMDSTIDWANLMIDNTPPNINFHFEDGGASNDTYRKNGKATIDADDPDLVVPPQEPEIPNVELPEVLPSRGIYRPSNMTGDAAPSVGLVYYFWSQSPDNPFEDKTSDHYAALKRYSLTGLQPREDLYKEGEDADRFASISLAVVNNKTNMLAPPSEALLPDNSGIWYLHAWTADMTWDSARELVQYEKMKKYINDNPEQYETWLNEHDGSESDKIVYAEGRALEAVGDYADLKTWSLDEFKQDDSNWSYQKTEFRLDNRVPDVVFTNIDGNATAEADITVNIQDPHSGLDGAAFQFVKKGEQPSGASWQVAIPDSSGNVQISTLNHVYEDGEYMLYIRAVDMAGNLVETSLEQSIVIDSTSTVRAAFRPESNSSFSRAHDVEFYLSGLESASVSYAVSPSVVRPADSAAYTTVSSSVYREPGDPDTVTSPTSGGEYGYHLSIDSALNGMRYVHVIADPGDGSRIYTYFKAYYFDNEPPVVGFSRTSVPYPQQTHDVKVSVAEEADRAAVALRMYQWVKEGDPAPDAASELWIALPENGDVSIDAEERLLPGETANYQLWVYAVDAAGNSTITSTGPFSVSYEDSSTPSTGVPSLIHMYGDQVDGFTGILELKLNSPDKRGYEYSISADGGIRWSRWQPYTNFASVSLPTDNLGQLNIKLKYRKNGGQSGDAIPLEIGELPETEPVYALAKLNSTKPVQSGIGVDIDITTPMGIRVRVAEDNPPSGVEQRGNVFRVRENGYYAFDLSDLADSSRTGKLYVVVNNIDDTPPAGSIYYMSVSPTNGNAIVKLESNEPITVTQLEILDPETLESLDVLNQYGRNTYTFTQNGSVIFRFEDEAGNSSEAIATVTNIDKTAPAVRIVTTYRYGAGIDDEFGTIVDGNGDVLAAEGAVLTVEKRDPDGKDFKVMGTSASIIVRKNGTYTFTVSDRFGNTSQVSETVDNLIETRPEPEQITVDFVDVNGNLLPEDQIKIINGKPYAKGKRRLTITGQTDPANIVFQGSRPSLDESGNYTNRVSDEDGNYSITRMIEGNGAVVIALTDLVGHTNKITTQVEGLDNTPPEITLLQPLAGITLNKSDFNAAVDLGGYIVSDNVSDSANIVVTLTGLDLTKLGHQRVTYTAVDEVGNSTSVVQDVYVVNGDGLLIFANGLLISSSLGETALFDTKSLTFKISGFDKMAVGGVDVINEWGTYDIFYQSGLYREGQLKSIATKLTYEELISNNFKVEFPKSGWYTIIVRTQEREREFATFFIG